MKEKWQVYCPNHKDKFKNPQIFYKKMYPKDYPKWILTQTCGLEPV